jgi:pSer/pThr/pTyr-binding forkhead associated (FHA) protein
MAKLILSMDGLVLKEIQLTKERTTIGRKPHNDIQIDNLAVSGEHAVLVTILADSFLEDLGSTNGTMVNGQSVKKHFMQNNDVIEMGKYKLKYVADTAPAGAAKADFEKTMILRPGAMRPAPAAPVAATAGASVDSPAPIAAAAAPLMAKAGETQRNAAPVAMPPSPAASVPAQKIGMLRILSGAIAGRELELIKPLTTLGKPGVQVAVLTRRPQGYFVTHVEGANQPSVNGQSIGTAPHALKDHDLIELAGVKMEFFYKV